MKLQIVLMLIGCILSACAGTQLGKDSSVAVENARASHVGKTAVITAYCFGESEVSVRGLSRAIAMQGLTGYVMYMRDQSNTCGDSRINSEVTAITVRVVERLWEVETPEGQIVVFWKLMDVGGQIGYTWFEKGFFDNPDNEYKPEKKAEPVRFSV